jgi:hypothetical protein
MGIAQFHSLYRKAHSGKLDGVEEYLDARYRESYRNPVKGEKYRAEPGRTNRVVLAESFTGAGCIPCIPFDYSFETALEDYTREELALLVYHWHAPTLDPMGNRASDARVKYYGVVGAPTVFLNGARFSRDVDSSLNEDREPNTARRTYAALNSKIKRMPRLLLNWGSNCRRSATGQTSRQHRRCLKTLPVEMCPLHVALVEEILRRETDFGFHPMVVQASPNLATRVLRFQLSKVK